jgi:ADP-ribosyl-[dinitrogen reductase] hydrolase
MDKIFGCVLGAFCGDALGGPLEFSKEWSSKIIDNAMLMKGGGILKLEPGQITDDSEMAMCMAHGLSECGAVLNLKNIARYYRKWMDSRPIGISGV